MKILLLNPPAVQGVKMVREGRCMQREGAWTAVWAPISLATMAAVLKKEAFEVKLIDAIIEGVDFFDLKRIITAFKPQLVVINTATGSIESDLSVAALVKKTDLSIKTVAFGIHVTALTDDSFKLEPKLDFVIRGEPEATLRDLAKALRKKASLRQIKGLSYRQKRKIVHNPDQPPITNLDQLPFPAWEEVKIDLYRMPFSGQPFLLVGTGRGCPFQCLFCADKTFYGQKLRLSSVKKIVDEIERNVTKFQVKEFLFWSESFTLNQKFALAVCQEIIKRKLKIHFVINSRVDNVNRKFLTILKKAGGMMVGYGVESANNRVLKAMNKGINVSQIKRAVKMTKEMDLEVTGHFVLGFPGETKESILKTIDLACSLPFDYAQFYCAVPFPGSELYQMALRKNWLKAKDWNFFEQNFSVLETPSLSALEIMNLRKLAFRRFYLRPKIIFQMLLRLKNPRVFFWFLKTGWHFISWIK